MSEPQQSPWAYASVGLELVIPVALLTYGGYRLDGRLDTLPLFLLLGVFLGMAVGFYSVYRRIVPRKGSGR